MNQNRVSFSDEIALSIDNKINSKSQTRASIYGWIVGVIVYSFLISLIVLKIIHIPKIYLNFIFIVPFPSFYVFVKANFFLWSNKRVLERQVKNIDTKDCNCDLGKLPSYGEIGWKEARYCEFYTCILYGFITRFILGCGLMSILTIVVAMIYL
jgi:hypothetical protein